MTEPLKIRSLRENQFVPPTAGYLIGGECCGCGTHFYPTRVVCPKCNSEEMKQITLSSRGTVYAYTIVHQTYPMTMLSNDVPFISAQVMLPEKAWVLAQIRDCDLDKVKVGMEVELCFWPALQEGDTLFMAPAFRPVVA
ncbi:MAG: OB-fold domain-containing protein [Chloroflexota bacterium]|nr:OB-fold domain-containing protein [Chloroflexota bacterium]